MNRLDDSPLGHANAVPDEYAPQVLFPVARAAARSALSHAPVCHGQDIWNAYEISWLGTNGRPHARLGELRFDAGSPNIIESKSLKLYLNSLNNVRFASATAVCDVIRQDLSAASGAPVAVVLHPLAAHPLPLADAFAGWCIDDDIAIDQFELDASLLRDSAREGAPLCATVYTNLMRSCCPVTGQPDWASVMLRYQGRWIDHAALLRYLVSYRNNAEFHELCVERIFADVEHYCKPDKLTVFARYTRRGGLDINPFRSNFEAPPDNVRQPRQ